MKEIEPTAAAKTVSAICVTCGKQFDRQIFMLWGREFFRVRECSRCNTLRERSALSVENQERQRASAKAVLRICPARYRNFDHSRLPVANETIDAILKWRPAPRIEERRSLCLPGLPHVGKRRLIFALAADLFLAGFQIAQISAADFEALAPLRSDRESGSLVRRRLMQLRSTEILIFTDVGAERLTESAQREFYGLVEHRAQDCLPVLWTTQFSKEQITARFVNSDAPEIALARGRAAVDRLNEISDVIEVERRSSKLWDRKETLLAQA
jgi:DNA replication protein DnaC